MSEKSKYRIIEKYKLFYIQKRRKIGWTYLYMNSDNSTAFLVLLFSIGLTVMSIIFREYVLLYVSIFLIGVTIFSFIHEKYNFSSLRDAGVFIEQKISSEKNKIEKNKRNTKIHYLDIKTERLDKLEKLKK